MKEPLPFLKITLTPRHSLRWLAEVFWNLCSHRIILRYKETALGFGWILLQPVALTVIFNYIRKVASIPTNEVPYPLFVATGLIAWSFTSLAISQSVGALEGNSSLLKRTFLPKILLPLTTIFSTLADLLVMVLLLVGLFIYYGFGLSATALWVFPILAIHLALLIGVCTLLSVANVFLRDIGFAAPHLLWLWFFASPVFYPASMVPEEFKSIARWNPITGLIESYRAVLLGSTHPPMDLFIPAGITTALILIAGLTIFRRLEPVLVDLL